jgi:hypothetical protein
VSSGTWNRAENAWIQKSKGLNDQKLEIRAEHSPGCKKVVR